MAGERKFMRIPPDSSGKRVALEHTAQITYDNKDPNYVWTPNEFYVTGDGIRIFLFEVYESTSTTGMISVRYSKNDEYENLEPAQGSNIIDLSTNQAVASIASVRDLWYNAGSIVGASSPSNGLDIDATGSANIRFAEGKPQLDAFGKLRTSAGTLLGEYVFNTELTIQQFATTELNNGTVTHDFDTKGLVVASSSSASSEARVHTNCYHHYIPGSSQLFMMTAAISDPTASGAIRHWGLMDEKNGFAFTINEQGEFGVTVRSSTSGSVSETFILQDDFNGDRADGSKDSTNISTMDLDLTKDNLYWLDVQWLGAGRVRFGVFYQGERVVLHEYFHGNFFPFPLSQTASLPIGVTVRNVSAAVPLQVKFWCASVWTEATVDINTLGLNTCYTSQLKSVTAGPTDDMQPLIAFAPRREIVPGVLNHRLYMINSISVVAFDSTTGEQTPVEFQIGAEPVFTDFNFVEYPTSSIEVSESVTAFDTGRNALSRVVYGSNEFDITEILNSIQYGSIRNYADHGGTRENTITNITQGSPAVVTTGERLSFQGASRRSVTVNGVAGMTQVNGNDYFVSPTGVNSAELYLDEEHTQPLDTTGFSAYTSGGTMKGFFGHQQHWGIFARNLKPNTTSSLMFTLSWKEIVQ